MERSGPLVVSAFDNLSEDHVSEIRGSDLFALDCEGVDLGRTGDICIIQLSTRKSCYLFDVLGHDSSSGLIQFLKEMLEDATKTKVIHDCKMDADALLHQYGIYLTGVHDTQCWDVLLRDGVPLNLNRTLSAYNCDTNDQRDHGLYRENPRFWATRPITSRMIEWACGDVRHLFDLYSAQMAMAGAIGEDVRARAATASEVNASSLRRHVMMVG